MTTHDDPAGQPTAPMPIQPAPPPGSPPAGPYGPAGGQFASAPSLGSAGEQLLASALGDSCAACGAPLAGDQRYCLECGERRGKPRFSLSSPATPRRQPAGHRARRVRVSANTTLVAGIATLLLAMGVGVLIGRIGNTNSSGRGATPVSVNLTGSGAASTTAATTAAATPTTTVKKKKKTTASAAAASSSSAVPTKVQAPPPKTVTVGQPCNGAGCQNGHFTGNFFGN
jgi:hypothetical protein